MNGLKRNIVIDAKGNPLALVCGRANHHDQKFALRTVDRVTVGGRVRRPKRLGADKGYDSNQFRKELKKRQIQPCLIRRRNNRKNIAQSELKEKKYSRQRWKVERSFNWLNNNRRVDRFMEKKMSTYQGFCHLMFIKYYLKKLVK
ncbi:MAG: IS5 family transposase [Candidatus Kerfeldbacteria bacterium]|nr:IS5 family transposase [Candidatus Kerfeldbacteria bacterium]